MSWIKKQIQYLIESIWQMIQGFILFSLAFSGLGCALLLRHVGYNGIVISGVSIIFEGIALVLCYFLIKGYLKTEEIKVPESKKKLD